MADIESILWEMFDEDRGQFGASGSPTYIAEVLTEKLTSGEAVEQAARALVWETTGGGYVKADDRDRGIARRILAAAIKGENDD